MRRDVARKVAFVMVALMVFSMVAGSIMYIL